VSRLKGEPHNADFFFLLKNLAFLVVPGVLFFSAAGAYLTKKVTHARSSLKEDKKETYKDVLIRSGKVFLFIMALELWLKVSPLWLTILCQE
jgi:predicted cation transporter